MSGIGCQGSGVRDQMSDIRKQENGHTGKWAHRASLLRSYDPASGLTDKRANGKTECRAASPGRVALTGFWSPLFQPGWSIPPWPFSHTTRRFGGYRGVAVTVFWLSRVPSRHTISEQKQCQWAGPLQGSPK